MCRCLILLSTYNGEKYLPELLESVLAQKDIYVDILARDDGSTDKTVEILKKYDRVKVYGVMCTQCQGHLVFYFPNIWTLSFMEFQDSYNEFCRIKKFVQ